MSVRVMRVGHVWMSVCKRLMCVLVSVASAGRYGYRRIMLVIMMVVSCAVNVGVGVRQH